MIILEQHIAISIYHKKFLLHFDVIEMLSDDGTLAFKVMKNKEYFFTLIGDTSNHTFQLKLSKQDQYLDFNIDDEVLSKMKVALFSVFLNESAS